MKKLLSIILASVIIVGICVFPANAYSAEVWKDGESYTTTNSPVYFVWDVYDDDYFSKDYVELGYNHYESLVEPAAIEFAEVDDADNIILKVEDYIAMVANLKELYYHYDSNGEIDWLLFSVRAWTGNEAPMCGAIGSTILVTDGCRNVFRYDLGIYVIAEERFYPVESAVKQERFRYILDEILYEVGISERVALLGDVNFDNQLDITDATQIQKYLSGELKYPKKSNDFWKGPEHYDYLTEKWYDPLNMADTNRDGVNDVNDVTSLQKYIAKIDDFLS